MAFNILVVDDSAVVRTIIIKTLRICGIDIGEIHEAGDGQQGLDILEHHWIDLVFADINMPVMDGETMIRTIREQPIWSDLPIIVVSTEGSETRIQQLNDLGASFIHKPFSPEKIRDMVLQVTGVSNESKA